MAAGGRSPHTPTKEEWLEQLLAALEVEPLLSSPEIQEMIADAEDTRQWVNDMVVLSRKLTRELCTAAERRPPKRLTYEMPLRPLTKGVELLCISHSLLMIS